MRGPSVMVLIGQIDLHSLIRKYSNLIGSRKSVANEADRNVDLQQTTPTTL